MIVPGDSLTVRFTPPRAGTFMYHVHGGHRQELLGGLYGPLLVLDAGRSRDATRDLLFVISISKQH